MAHKKSSFFSIIIFIILIIIFLSFIFFIPARQNNIKPIIGVTVILAIMALIMMDDNKKFIIEIIKKKIKILFLNFLRFFLDHHYGQEPKLFKAIINKVNIISSLIWILTLLTPIIIKIFIPIKERVGKLSEAIYLIFSYLIIFLFSLIVKKEFKKWPWQFTSQDRMILFSKLSEEIK